MAHKNNFVESWDEKYLSNLKDGFNYAAGDYATLKEAIWKYIAMQSQEDFNDWSDSGEVGMFVNGLSYLGENINYRIDLNANDNFITTATRTSSVLNFAKLLSYTPKRNICAKGLGKIVSISTTEPVEDYNGKSLANTIIRWNDSSNSDWQNQFLTILNSAFIYTNPYGKPCKLDSINEVATQLYKVNSEQNANGGVYTFSLNVNNENVSAESVIADIKDNEIVEHRPDIYENFALLYRNDGAGNSSADTGFFIYWKQGTLQSETYNFDTYIRYQKIELAKTNINNDDIWVQEIDPDTEVIKTEWKALSNDEYIAYSTRKQTDADIYKIETTTDDGVILTFPDGNFGNVPMGYYKIYYRVSSPNQMYIGVKDVQNITITIPYKSSSNTTDNTVYYLKLTFSVQKESHISQNIQKEDIESIKDRAPEVASCQNRMISNSDYNYYPLSLGNKIKKIMAINRFSAGNSRFVDLNDTSGIYKALNIEGEDGYIYSDESHATSSEIFTGNNTNVENINEFIIKKLAPLFASTKLQNFYYSNYSPIEVKQPGTGIRQITWQNNSDNTSGIYKGHFEGNGAIELSQAFSIGTLIKLVKKQIGSGDSCWIKIEEASSDKTTFIINQPVVSTDNNKWYVDSYYPAFRTEFNNDEISAISTEISAENSFYIYWDDVSLSWKPTPVKENKWVANIVYTGTSYDVTVRYLDYIFGSQSSTAFFYDEDTSDTIKIFRYNYSSEDKDKSLDEDYYWVLYDKVSLSNGLTDNNKVEITFNSSDDDGTPDNPNEYNDLVQPVDLSTYVILQTKDPVTQVQDIHEYIHSDIEKFLFFERNPSTDEMVLVDGTKVVFSCWEILEKGLIGSFFSLAGGRIYPVGTIVTQEIYEDIEWEYNKRTFITYPYPDTLEVGDVLQYPYASSEYKPESKDPITPSALTWKFVEWDGTNSNTINIDEDDTTISADGKYKIVAGKRDISFLWKHTPTKSLIIDPATTNLIDMYLLTTEYYNKVQNWLSSKTRGDFPIYPNCETLRQQFKSLNDSKATSDSLIFHPIKYKLLFGEQADVDMRCSFRVIKGDSSASDNDIKQQVISLIDSYFQTMNIGTSFYFTNLSVYVKEEMNGLINSIVPVPTAPDSVFGNLFEIQCEKDEILLSCATVSDVQIISSISKFNIRMGS